MISNTRGDVIAVETDGGRLRYLIDGVPIQNGDQLQVLVRNRWEPCLFVWSGNRDETPRLVRTVSMPLKGQTLRRKVG